MPKTERTDGELLADHLAGGEGFAELARRHAPLVLAAARRALGPDEAEDAAQAVFIVLAGKARGLTGSASLAGWLHRATRMVCGTALRARARRRRREREAAEMREMKTELPRDPERAALLKRLDAAVAGLPAGQREVAALCYLEGISQKEAARRTGMPLGTVAVYARRGLERLRGRLAGRGAALSAAGLGALLIEESSAVAVSAEFVSSVAAVANGAAAAGAAVSALAKGGMQAMTWVKIKIAAMALCAVTVAGAGGLVAVRELAAAEPKPEKKLNPRLASLPASTWVHVKVPRNPVGRSYSGLCCGGGYIFYFGGGHGSHPGNGVELFNVANGTWELVTEEESWRDAPKWKHVTEEQQKTLMRCISGGSTSTLTSPKNRPLVHHTYQMHAWFPEKKAFYSLVRSHLWAFDPAKREWKRLSEKAPAGLDVHTWGLRYDPEIKTLVAIVSAGPRRGVYLYDAGANSWAKKCDTPAADWTEVHSAYDSARKVHVVRSNKKWWTLDLAAGRTKLIKDLGEVWRKARGKEKAPHIESLSMDYDPEAKATLVIMKPLRKGPVELWAYSAGKDDWSEVKMKGVPPKGIASWGLLDYDPGHKCHLFLNLLNVGGGFIGGRTDGLFAFRCEKAGN